MKNIFIAALFLTLPFCSIKAEEEAIAPSEIEITAWIEKEPLIGNFENGISYSITSNSSQSGTFLKLNCLTLDDDEDFYLSKLTQRSLFSETKKYNHSEILNILNSLELNAEISEHLKLNEFEQSLCFSLENSCGQSLTQVIDLMNEIYFFPTLSDEGIEFARLQLLREESFSEEDLLTFKGITAEEVREYYKKTYTPIMMQLVIFNAANPRELLKELTGFFGPATEIELKPENSEEAESVVFTDSVEYHSQSKAYVVDGKIWMDSPDWKNRSSTGKKIGAACLAGGLAMLGAAFFAFPLGPFILSAGLFMGFASTTAGAYFLFSPYYKDPYYVEKIRSEDLIHGCAYAYKNGTAGITLTPFERRSLFIQEMVYYPQNLSKLPILLLADLYQLKEPLISELFTTEEFIVLNDVKRDFIIQRNEYAILKANLESELSSMCAPFSIVRDSALKAAKDSYHQNYYVSIKRNFKADRDNEVRSIERDFQAGYISMDYRNTLLQEADERYERKLLEIEDGLSDAKRQLEHNERDIERIYDSQVEFCKQSINYHGRMAAFEDGEYSLIQYFNEVLYKVMVTFPIHLPALPDYLDLRTNS